MASQEAEEARPRLFGQWRQAHTRGYLWDNTASGLVLSTSTFLMLALLRLATVASGCPGNPEDDDETCSKSTHGLKPESWLTLVATLGQLSGAALTPFVGAVSDYTAHRRKVGATSAWVLAATTLIQAGVSQETWFAMTLIQILAIAAYVVHQATVLSYLPGLSRIDDHGLVDDADVRIRVNSASVVAGFGANLVAYVSFGAVFLTSGLGIVNMANVVQGVVGVMLVGIYGIIWHRRYSGALIDVPPLKRLPDGVGADFKGIFKVAQREVRASRQLLSNHFPDIGRFLVGYSLSNAAATSFSTLAVVFLAQHLNFTSGQILVVFAEVLVVSVPAGALAVPLMRRFSPKRVFITTIVVFAASTFLAFLSLFRSTASLVYFFGLVWGVCFGVYYAANTSLFTQLVPKHAESYFMSLFYFSSIILSWLPPAIFTLLNQLTNAIRTVFLIITFFFVSALPIFSTVDVDRARLAIKAHDDNLARRPPGADERISMIKLNSSTLFSSFFSSSAGSTRLSLDQQQQQSPTNSNNNHPGGGDSRDDVRRDSPDNPGDIELQ